MGVETNLKIKIRQVWLYHYCDMFLDCLYESTGRATGVASVSASALLKMLKFLVKVFKNLYLLNL